MKKLKIILIFLLFLCICNISLGIGNIKLISNKSIIQKDEEFDVSINIENVEIAALTLEIYWDNSKLEYISGPENSNSVNNRILYTWVSEDGENKNGLTIESFKFKGIQEDDISTISARGEFYNSKGEEVEIENGNLEVKIGKESEEANQIILHNENVTDDNSDLAILRLNHEGISPDFNKDIKEYYFVTNEDIKNLDITAIPENSDASVIITGNDNLQIGENTIEIKVESKDKTKISIYKIYFTKTSNLETANANLETLAVREAELEPEFNSGMTQYKIDIANNIDRIYILAIPQKENATVDIVGNGEMQVGDNKIEINVLAENKSTHKKYEILVHRRNEEEQKTYEKEQEYQTERLSEIIEEEQNKDENTENQKNKDENTENRKNKNIAIIVTIIVILFIAISIIIYQKNKNKQKERNND